MDWKDALGSLLQEGNLPEGGPDATADATPAADTDIVQKTPVHVLIEKRGAPGRPSPSWKDSNARTRPLRKWRDN